MCVLYFNKLCVDAFTVSECATMFSKNMLRSDNHGWIMTSEVWGGAPVELQGGIPFSCGRTKLRMHTPSGARKPLKLSVSVCTPSRMQIDS